MLSESAPNSFFDERWIFRRGNERCGQRDKERDVSLLVRRLTLEERVVHGMVGGDDEDRAVRRMSRAVHESRASPSVQAIVSNRRRSSGAMRSRDCAECHCPRGLCHKRHIFEKIERRMAGQRQHEVATESPAPIDAWWATFRSVASPIRGKHRAKAWGHCQDITHGEAAGRSERVQMSKVAFDL
jgi:hypothetical protein